MNDYTYSAEGLALTKRFEGLELKAYQDPGLVLTIGYGHTGKDVHPGMVITEAEAEALLEQDIQWAVRAVNRLVTVPISQQQFDALVDFTYNLGAQAFEKSSILVCVNLGRFDEAERRFSRFVYQGKEILPGLIKRRAAEAELFAATPVLP